MTADQELTELPMATSEAWSRMRRILSPSFSASRLKAVQSLSKLFFLFLHGMHVCHDNLQYEAFNDTCVNLALSNNYKINVQILPLLGKSIGYLFEGINTKGQTRESFDVFR